MRIYQSRMRHLFTLPKVLILFCLSILPFLASATKKTSDFILPKVQVLPIKDTQANRQYELYIKLPEGYSKNTDKTYPVIYFTDAVWHVELISASTEFLMQDAILVGISWQKDIKAELKKERGEHVSRYRDYTVKESSNKERQAKYQFGQASNHLDFIRNDVIKTVEKHYRADPNERSYFGYSAGGLFGAYVLLAKPDTFKNYILGSPSVDGDMPILAKLKSNTAIGNKNLKTNVFISYGNLEKKLGTHIEALITLLKTKNDKSLNLNHLVIEGSHQTAFPMTGVRGITWLSNLNSQQNQ